LIGRAREQGRERTARRVMVAAIVVNLAVLFCWKYTVFAAKQLDRLIGLFGRAARLDTASVNTIKLLLCGQFCFLARRPRDA